ncbi:ribosome maturation factor RimM [Alkaliphilus hydrothermalis]|uniref:Ribosome maturation factor RimM n=1 Tax=Alkaliphilus hydrothermalis TaxID=1482730 RepID=A0ABS2NL16_9FIRM|nr:ribosome maturation factor RimM [Alkaliphilus hydrothermalis]MBM7613635.1 16S rRNA processing protein RimM [Alkaliphilus hydrothermalis]
MKKLKVGRIINTHGIKGGLKVTPLTDELERFAELEWVYIEGVEGKFYINKVQYQKNNAIITFKDLDDINLVEKFKTKFLYIDESQKRELPEDTFYISDIIGLKAYTVDHVYLGKVKDILQAGSNEVYIIANEDGKEYLIPSVKEFIPVIDIEGGKIIVDPIEGMIE